MIGFLHDSVSMRSYDKTAFLLIKLHSMKYKKTVVDIITHKISAFYNKSKKCPSIRNSHDSVSNMS